MKIVVLGSPGVGKGTYTQDLVKILGLVHVSSGDLFRDNIKAETELGKKAQEFIMLALDLLKTATQNDRNAQAYIVDHLKIMAGSNHGFLDSSLNLDVLFERYQSDPDNDIEVDEHIEDILISY